MATSSYDSTNILPIYVSFDSDQIGEVSSVSSHKEPMLLRSKLYFQVLLLLVYYFLHISTPLHVLAQTSNVTDRLALLSFKSLVTTGDALASWNDSSGICNWFGVRCGAVLHPDRVTSLSLDSLKLNGIISPSLSNLTFLRQLSLGENKIHGVIPQELGNLPRLSYLNLSTNSLEGEIPVSLSRCSKLELISLDDNKLYGKIPANLSQASKLQYLILKNNNLTGEIPTELGSLQNLLMLSLRNNYLTGSIPPSLGNISSLYGIFLSDNNLVGSIPPELSLIPNLVVLDVMFNRLSGEIHPSLFNFSRLYTFGVGGNLLTGTLPSDFGQYLPELGLLYLYDNKFQGPIPFSLVNASKLELIQLSNNSFTGLVPPIFGRIEKLTSVILGRNFFEAREVDDWSFITSLTNCSLLKELDLSNNNFTGFLPNSISNLSSSTLEWLRLRDNQIMGEIPAGIGYISSLLVLNLENNQFSGSIPESIGKLQNLKAFSITANKFSGQIPTSIGNLTQMLELYMGGNRLTGSIPPELTSLKKLLVMDLARNNLSGFIPKGFLELPTMSLYLNISHNSLTGSLPYEVGSLANLKALDASANKFSGEIPQSIGKCWILEQLNLGDNGFTGTIPEYVGSLKGLQLLDVSLNQLSGRIPDFLENMPMLQFLNLSFNDFEGEVPSKGVFSNVSMFSVEGNEKLCGGTSNLNLRPCLMTKKNTKLTKPVMAVIVVLAISCFLLIIFFLVFKFTRKRENPRPESDVEILPWEDNDQFLKISYSELQCATNDFSSANLIGSGGFGKVYKGTIFHGKKTKKIAVKVLNETSRAISKSFMAECKVLRHVRHRNLVRVLTSCSTVGINGNEFKALVYDYMPNGSLQNWLQKDTRGELNLLTRLNIAIDVASALDYLHTQTEAIIVHCDLKPSNVLLDDDMVGRVSDFGIARFLSVDQDQTLTTGIQGSIGYIAPECGMGSRLSTRWDVYSYGILLLEMFTGKSPTDESLSDDGTTLHGYVEARFPDQIMDVVDPQLLKQECRDDDDGVTLERIRDTMVAVMKIGLLCSKDSPSERMQMEDVVKELECVKATVPKSHVKGDLRDSQSIAVHRSHGNSSSGWDLDHDSLAEGR